MNSQSYAGYGLRYLIFLCIYRRLTGFLCYSAMGLALEIQESWATAKTTAGCAASCALCMGALKNLQNPYSLSTAVRPRLLLPKFLIIAFVPIDPMNVRTKFEVRSFTRSWDNSNCSFGLGCEPQSWGRAP